MNDMAAPPPLPQRVVIAGDGLAAWMTAAALANAVNLVDYSIRVIGCDRTDDGFDPFDAADATLPSPTPEHVALELDEDRLVAETGAAFTYGVALSGWATLGATWFHPFGSVGAALGPVAFHHLVMRLRREGIAMRLADYSLAALAAQSGRFARPGQDPRSVRSASRYGLHLDCAALTGTLRSSAEATGIARVAGTLREVERGADGTIAALTTRDGQRIEGDLFIDCTGTAARLIGNADADWESWSAWLPADRVLTARIDRPLAPPPYSHAEANEAGWIRHLPLQGKTLLTEFYSTRASTDDAAGARLREAAGSSELADAQCFPARFGRRRQAWQRNCIALGSAAVLIDPVATTNLQLLRFGIDRLLRLLPGDRAAAAESAEYNRLTGLHLDHARDFAMLHYKLNGRRGEQFWDACRAMPVPSSLDYKMRLYQSRGRVAMYDEEPLEEASWLNLYDANGMHPRQYNPIADGFSIADLKSHVGRVRAIMIDELGRMPPHGDYLSRVKAASNSSAGNSAVMRREEQRIGRFMGDSA